jgi:hypothetical protein
MSRSELAKLFLLALAVTVGIGRSSGWLLRWLPMLTRGDVQKVRPCPES